jgi:LmbE family N-acetylglucosaminyl deacetylase
MELMFQNKKIMMVVAHPDDELLGPGATMHKLIKKHNCRVRVIILGEGITSRSDKRDTRLWKKELAIHRKNIDNATRAIGYHEVKTYDFPDNRFDSVALLDIVKAIEKEKDDFKPEIIFTHHGGDTNIDHRQTFDAVITATRPMSHETVKTIVTFETPSSTEWQAFNHPNYFKPNLFIEVSKKDVEAKIKGMESYEFEKRKYPHPRSPKALEIQCQRNGIIVGKEYAEAFMLIRSII